MDLLTLIFGFLWIFSVAMGCRHYIKAHRLESIAKSQSPSTQSPPSIEVKTKPEITSSAEPIPKSDIKPSKDILALIDQLKGRDQKVYLDDVRELLDSGKERDARTLIDRKNQMLDKRTELMNEIKSIEKRIENLASKVADGEISDSTFKEAKETLEIKKIEIQEQLSDIDFKLYKEEFEKPVF